MVELTPLDKTVAGQELIQIGFQEGIRQAMQAIEQGMEIGEFIGGIRLAQRMLKRPVSPKQELAEKPVEELQDILHRLEAELDESL